MSRTIHDLIGAGLAHTAVLEVELLLTCSAAVQGGCSVAEVRAAARNFVLSDDAWSLVELLNGALGDRLGTAIEGAIDASSPPTPEKPS